MTYTNDGVVLQPQGVNRDAEPIHIKRTRHGSEENHWLNFLECVRNRAPEKCDCSADLGYYTNVGISMGVMSYRQQKVFKWDADKQEASPV